MALLTLQTLPPEVQAVVFDDQNTDINGSIAVVYRLSPEQLTQVLQVLVSVITKEIPVLEFHVVLSKLQLQNVDVIKLALDFALLRLWPLQRYLGDVDRLIIRLGGKVPAVVPAIVPIVAAQKISQEAELIDQESDDLVLPVKDFLADNGLNKDLFLTTNYIHDEAGRLVEPTVTNWLKDYLHFAGAEASDNLVRSQYLIRSVNAKVLPSAEKDNILNFLASYNEGRPMRLVIEDNLLTLAEIGEAQPKIIGQQIASLDQILEQYHQYVSRLQLQLDRLRDGLTVESGNEGSRLADLLWNAIGLSERERALMAVILLAEKQYLPELLRSDQRYISILRRYVNVRFGDRAKTLWQAEWSAANWTLFLQLLLEEKIQLPPTEAPMAAEYVSQIMKLSTPAVYIDLAAGQFRWRQVQYGDKRFTLQ